MSYFIQKNAENEPSGYTYRNPNNNYNNNYNNNNYNNNNYNNNFNLNKMLWMLLEIPIIIINLLITNDLIDIFSEPINNTNNSDFAFANNLNMNNNNMMSTK